jgi:hypothetical protein
VNRKDLKLGSVGDVIFWKEGGRALQNKVSEAVIWNVSDNPVSFPPTTDARM